MNVDNEAVKTIAKEIKKATKQAVNSAAVDHTVKARILSYLGNNKYHVQLNNGESYEAISFDKFTINEIVYVKIAENNYNNLIIEASANGKTNQTSDWSLEITPLSL